MDFGNTNCILEQNFRSAAARDSFDRFVIENNIEFERGEISFNNDFLMSILQLHVPTKSKFVCNFFQFLSLET